MLIGMAAFYVWNEGAKIKHFNYCQVHSIRKQADKVLKFSVLAPGAVCFTCHFSLLTCPFLMKF